MAQRSPKANGGEDREARVLHAKALTGVSCTFIGKPVSIEFLPALTAHRGKLLSGTLETGQAVHAASFMRKRQIILDSSLRGNERTRILLHELFHFAWIRLSNAGRDSFAGLIQAELDRRARGELGWSSEWRKQNASNPFRDYLCESFCDSGAWCYGLTREHEEFTLARTWCGKRREWFDQKFPNRHIPI